MRSYPQVIGKRPVVVAPGRRWWERISRMRRGRRERASRSVDVIRRQAQLEQRAWDHIPDPRWHRGRR